MLDVQTISILTYDLHKYIFLDQDSGSQNSIYEIGLVCMKLFYRFDIGAP